MHAMAMCRPTGWALVRGPRGSPSARRRRRRGLALRVPHAARLALRHASRRLVARSGSTSRPRPDARARRHADRRRAAGAVLMPVTAIRGTRIPLVAAIADPAVLVGEAAACVDRPASRWSPASRSRRRPVPACHRGAAPRGFRRLVAPRARPLAGPEHGRNVPVRSRHARVGGARPARLRRRDPPRRCRIRPDRHPAAARRRRTAGRSPPACECASSRGAPTHGSAMP